MTVEVYDEEKQLRIRRNEEPGYFPFTYSRASRYKDCAKWYKFEYIDKLGYVGSDKAELGSALHVFQELLFTDGIERANEIATAMVPLSMSEEWENAKAIIEQITIKKDFLFAAEAKFHYEFTVPFVSEDTVTNIIVQQEAKIDQLFVYPEQGIAEIVDGKSGRAVEKDVEHDFQLKLYALTVLKNLEELGLHTIIGTQAQWRLGRLVSASWSVEELQSFEQTVEKIAAEMVNEERFRAKPNTHCMWCPFALQCDAAQKMLPKEVTIGGKTLPVIIDSDETASQVGEGILHLEAMLARYRNSLRGFIREFDSAVRVGEKAFDFHTHKTLKIGNIEDLINKAHELNIDLSPYISFNNTTGKTLIRNHPEIREALVQSQYSKFEFRKSGEVEED